MIEKETRVTNEYGIHARPSALICTEASKYKTKAYLTIPSRSDERFRCDSIMELMTLEAGLGTKLVVHVEGDDEEARIMCDNLVKLISSDFETQVAEFNKMQNLQKR
ncbi:MAG: HPr family phosphocarrier protein [Nanoarchaeota archaeon]